MYSMAVITLPAWATVLGVVKFQVGEYPSSLPFYHFQNSRSFAVEQLHADFEHAHLIMKKPHQPFGLSPGVHIQSHNQAILS
jgi:hypothetical protein